MTTGKPTPSGLRDKIIESLDSYGMSTLKSLSLRLKVVQKHLRPAVALLVSGGEILQHGKRPAVYGCLFPQPEGIQHKPRTSFHSPTLEASIFDDAPIPMSARVAATPSPFAPVPVPATIRHTFLSNPEPTIDYAEYVSILELSRLWGCSVSVLHDRCNDTSERGLRWVKSPGLRNGRRLVSREEITRFINAEKIRVYVSHRTKEDVSSSKSDLATSISDDFLDISILNK